MITIDLVGFIETNWPYMLGCCGCSLLATLLIFASVFLGGKSDSGGWNE